MKITKLLAASALLLIACTAQQKKTAPDGEAKEVNLTQYVDPHIGSGGHGHVFVGANVPFGMVQLGPTSIPVSWDWVSGYHITDSTVIGFSHNHLSGTGIGDLFDVTVMPVVGEVTYARGTEEVPGSGLWSYADRSKEVARPGYYSVPLTRYNILAELTATERVGLHRYTFPAAQEAAIVFDLENGGCWDKTTEAHIEAVNDTTIVGWRYSTGWAKNQRVYFAATLSKPMSSFQLAGNNNMYARVGFSTIEGEVVMLKVGLSAVSIDGAKAAVAAEQPAWDFEGVRTAADKAWNKQLAKIAVDADEKDKKIFYTALYHASFAPILFSDVNGDYRGADDKVYNSPTPHYSIFSLWDTYRAKMPLMSIMESEKFAQFVNTMLDICDQQGRLPVWHLWGNETDCMVGDPAIPVVADAIVKGISGIDRERAFAAIEKTTAKSERGRELRREYGYIPCDKFVESVAFDTEYALADGAAANAAKALGNDEAAERYTKLSHSYRHFYDKETRFLRGKKTTGEFNTPFNPYYSTHRADDYCEGNAWQYTWLVPHDVAGLAELFGGKEQLITKLDSLFTVPSVVEGDPSPDISGLIGQYAHGNEPSHHILYLYTMLGEPHKGAKLIREVLSTLYHAEPDGLSGNEDVGQMSAWYILSSLGLYEVEPASGRYWFGSPIVKSASVNVKGGIFKVETVNNSDKNIYIKSVKLNGKEYNLPYIDYSDIKAGNVLTFEMSDTPSLWYDGDILAK